MVARKGWGAALTGHQLDLEDWEEALKEPFDPWMVRTDRGPVLRSKALDAALTASEAHDLTGPLIAMLNGALGATHGTRPISLDCVVEFMSDGTERRHALATLAEALGRAKAVAVALGPDGQLLPPLPPQPSEAQRWLDIAATDDVLADALIYFSRGHDWFDIYKAWECLDSKFGRSMDAWAPKGEVSRLSYTANTYRHSRHKTYHSKRNRPPPPLMPMGEARAVLAGLTRRAFQEVGATWPTSP